MHYDAIIIGAGMSGLAAALRLAMFGRRVVVLERHEVWGGLNSFYTKDGHAFDVGLHALTNYASAGERGRPLTKLLRQLRIRHEELHLGEQEVSALLVPGARLEFDNDVERLTESIAEVFPAEVEGFRRLVRAVEEFGVDEDQGPGGSGRAFLNGFVRDPLLRDALLLPLLFYGSAREDDVDLVQLVVLFKSIFIEGLARPEGGIRPLINLIVKRCKTTGVELRVRAGVARVLVEDGRAHGVELESGETLTAGQVYSSAGRVETLALCGGEVEREHDAPTDVGRLSFVETISVLDRPPAELGIREATAFFATECPFAYRRPGELVDVRSGVVSFPTNFAAERPPRDPLARVTVLANHDAWASLPEDEYRARKVDCSARSLEVTCELLPDWRPHTTYTDVFTPRTIHHFTGHAGGAVYGSPKKSASGTTPVEDLILIGTDQGYLGVVGALFSGVTMANRHTLARQFEVPA